MKTLIFVFLALVCAFSSWAGTELVINLDGVIVQGIPYRNAAMFKPEDVIIISGRKNFVKLPLAQEFLAKIQKSGLVDKVILTGARTAAENTEILNGFKDLDTSFFEVRGDEIESFLSLKVAVSDNVFIISEKELSAKPSGGAELLVMAPTFFHFDSYSKAVAAKVDAQKAFFPNSEAEWDLHINKRGRLFYILLSALEKSSAPLVRAEVARLMKAPAKAQGELGMQVLMGDGKWSVWSWKKNVCEKHNLKTGLKELVADLLTCSKNLPVQKFWDGKTKDLCALYSMEGNLLGKVGREGCKGVDSHRIETRNKTLIIKTFPGIENLTLNELLARFSRSASFRNLLKIPAKALYMTSELGAACVKAINDVTDRGLDLSSQTLKKIIKPLSSIRFSSGVQDSKFYHWTSSASFKTTLKLDRFDPDVAYQKSMEDGTYEGMFDFLRTRTADRYQFWRRVFYVAEDTQSSAFLGNTLYEFDLDMNSPTISYDEAVWRASLKEIAARYPAIGASCPTDLSMYVPDTFGSLQFDNLFFIVAEDSGVEVVDYNQKQKWFQLLSPAPIKGVKQIR